MWFNLDGDKRLGRCATQGCGGQPIYRLEVGGTGSDFCSGCRELIESQTRRCFDALEKPPQAFVEAKAERDAGWPRDFEQRADGGK